MSCTIRFKHHLLAGDSVGNSDGLAELVRLVYDAALDPAAWPVFLRLLTETLTQERAARFGIGPEDVGRSLSSITRLDPEWRGDSPVPVPGYPSLTRDFTCLPFPSEASERNILITIAPHVRRALEISCRLARSLAFEESLNLLPVGVILTAPDARPLWWNRYAGEILKARDGLSASTDGLRTTAGSIPKSLDQLIREVTGGDANEERALSIPRRSLLRPYAVLISRLKLAGGLMGEATGIILVTDPERKLPSGTDARLANQFGLTPAEGESRQPWPPARLWKRLPTNSPSGSLLSEPMCVGSS